MLRWVRALVRTTLSMSWEHTAIKRFNQISWNNWCFILQWKLYLIHEKFPHQAADRTENVWNLRRQKLLQRVGLSAVRWDILLKMWCKCLLGRCTVNRKRAGVSVPTGHVGDNNMKIIHYSADQLLLTGPCPPWEQWGRQVQYDVLA